MVDPVTNNFSLIQPTVGADLNIWGGVLNNGAIAAIDATLGSNLAVAITVADVTLTAAQFQNAIFVISGALTGARNLILPLSPNSATVAVGGRFVVVNNTTAAYSLTVKTAASGSTGVVVPQGFTAVLYSDGTNVGYGQSGLPAFAQAVNGNPNSQLAGTAGSVNTNASLAFDYTNFILYVCTVTGNSSGAVWAQPSVPILRGFDTIVNLGLSVTHTGGNLLNIAVKTAAGADPAVGSSVIARFQTVSGSSTTGAPVDVTIASALSMTTNATGASMGSVNSVPFRIWLALFNNAGTAVLAMRNCSTATAIYSLAEYGVASTTAISGAAASAGVWYTPNGTTLTNCAFRIIGYCEYTSGLATAGTYSSDPSNVVLFGPGIKKPGDVVQGPIYGTFTGATTSTGNTNAQTTTTLSITPTSAVNLIRISANGVYGTTSGNMVAQLSRGTVPTLIGNQTAVAASQANLPYPAIINAIDAPNTASSVSYYVFVRNMAAGGNTTWNQTATGTTPTAVMILEEIMG